MYVCAMCVSVCAMCVHLCLYMCVCICVCVYVCIYLCTYICAYICVQYIYIKSHKLKFATGNTFFKRKKCSYYGTPGLYLKH